ncbi:MAG: PKD domain-containing protein [Bacteroidia bacterium]
MKHITFTQICLLFNKKTSALATFVLLFATSIFAQNSCEANFTFTLNQTTKTAVFTNTSVGTGLIYHWAFGDNTTSSAASPTKTFSTFGTYAVCLTITKSDSSCYHVRCSTLVLASPCLSTWTIATANGNNLSKNFASNNTSLDYNYFWTFGDNGISDSKTPNHIYAHAGRYKVCLRVIKKDSSCTTQTCDSITVTANTTTPCVSTWTVTTNPNTTTLARYFTSTSISTDFSYYWTFGDGSSSSSKNPNHTFPGNGIYRVCLMVTKKDSTCTNTTCTNITIGENNNGCNANWNLYTDSVNTLKKYFASASTSNDYNYWWSFGDGINSDSKTPNHVYSHAGRYKVCLKVSKKDSSCTLTVCDSITVSANVGCEANFTFTKTGREVHFTNTSGGTFTRTIWRFGDSLSSDQNSPTHTFGHNGTFNICLYTYRIANGDTSCRSSRCYNVTVTNLTNSCVASFIYGVNHLQRRLEVNSTSTGNNLLYRWTFGDDSTSNLLHPANHIYAHNGVYRVCLLVINALDTNCRSEYCRFINVNYHDSNIVHSVVQADFTKNTTNPSNNTIQFVNASSGAINYSWAFGDGSSSIDQNPLHSFETNGFYTVCLTASGPNGIDVFCNSVSSDNSTTRITNAFAFETLIVYPNPFNELVNIDLTVKTNMSITVQITDISGKIIENKKVELPSGNNNIRFETGHLNNGMYILNILGEGLNKNFKVIK